MAAIIKQSFLTMKNATTFNIGQGVDTNYCNKQHLVINYGAVT